MTYSRTDSEAAAWREIATRSDDVHAYCHEHELRLGQNIWHAVLDDAIRLRALHAQAETDLASWRLRAERAEAKLKELEK